MTTIAHKFGGTSVADAGRLRHVADTLLARSGERQVVVVSAMKGVTDDLIALVHRAATRDDLWRTACDALEARHADACEELLGTAAPSALVHLRAQCSSLRDVLHATTLLGTPSFETLAFVQGLGEVFNAQLLAAHFAARDEPGTFLDAREVLVVAREELGVTVDWTESTRRLAAWRAAHDADRIIVTGFVARDALGRAATLGRNGSDYSGAIFAALFDAAEIHIWTDVDGVFSADPRVVPEAVLVPELTYAEACELAYFGATVIHPQTMQPAIAKGIPIRIRNTFRPDNPGSLIARDAARLPAVKGVTTIDGLALLSVEGAGMIGVPGTAERVFAALHRAAISVVMISQGSSEHSICCVVENTHIARAVTEMEDAFAREIQRGQISGVVAERDISVLAVVGEGMAGTPGIAARLFDALASSRINIRAIAQGASERNISVAVASADAPRALRAVHAGFYLSPQTLSVGVIGVGHVGRALLDQFAATCARLATTTRVDVRVRAIANSRRMLLDDRAISLDDWRPRLNAADQPADLARFADHVAAHPLPHAIIIDCSASSAVADQYAGWLARGIHVITPNKHAGSGPLDRYRAIVTATRAARFRYEATVGAGLPVIQTLRDLVQTGDDVAGIQGMLSGTLAWLFNQFDGSRPFSALVAEAHALGYTEPDPRDDLSGTDVARKLVILAREIGLPARLDDVVVESLVPDALRLGSREEFMASMASMDDALGERLLAARRDGRVIRYVAQLDAATGRASVGLTALAPDHAFAVARLTDNVVQFTTRRYKDNPLVVQGPGAGPDVTAAGIFADLLRIAASLGAAL